MVKELFNDAVKVLTGGKHIHEILLVGSPKGDFHGFFHPHGKETEHVYTYQPSPNGLKGYRLSSIEIELLGYAKVDHALWDAISRATWKIWAKEDAAPCIGLPKQIWEEMLKDTSWIRVSFPEIEIGAATIYRAVGMSTRSDSLI